MPFWDWHHYLKYSTSKCPAISSQLLSCLLHLFIWVLILFQTALMGIQISWQTGTGNQRVVIRAGRNSKAVSNKGVVFGFGFVGVWVIFFRSFFLCTMHFVSKQSSFIRVQNRSRYILKSYTHKIQSMHNLHHQQMGSYISTSWRDCRLHKAQEISLRSKCLELMQGVHIGSAVSSSYQCPVECAAGMPQQLYPDLAWHSKATFLTAWFGNPSINLSW